LLGEIKQRRPDLPVMMVTAYGDDERRRRARELGAFEFISFGGTDQRHQAHRPRPGCSHS
jgi:CheY-like chemotaxis protein